MQRNDIRIRSSSVGEFDCYVATPDAAGRVPAIVLASAVQGVDRDIRALADEFAAQGYIAAAPDLFWRTIPGPLAHGDNRTSERSRPRVEKIRAGEGDMADTLAELRKLPQFNGRAVAAGYCYGGPYALIGPKRLGYAAGISCHGSQMLEFIRNIEGVAQPVCLIWGDQDHQMPAEVRDAYQAVASRMKNVEMHVIPGVVHAYMLRGNTKAFNQAAYDFSMKRSFEILAALR